MSPSTGPPSADKLAPMRRGRPWRPRQSGLTLVEVLAAMAIAVLLLAAVSQSVHTLMQTERAMTNRHELQESARFALERIARMVARSPSLLVPQADDPGTGQNESARNVLVLVLDPTLDRDGDGFADADNDEDGRIDEDLGGNVNGDGCAGRCAIDDDGDGTIDEWQSDDDDEDQARDEDSLNGIDDDGDGSVDEDPDADTNDDGCAGYCGVDDDGDGLIDEGAATDDDEDGASDEDWRDEISWHVTGTELRERYPAIGATSGTQVTEQTIASGVQAFAVTLVDDDGRHPLVELQLTLVAGADSVTRTLRVRVGSER